MTADEIEKRISELEAFFDSIPESDGVESNYAEFKELSVLYGLRHQ